MRDKYSGIIKKNNETTFYTPHDVKAYSAYLQAHPEAEAYWTPNVPTTKKDLISTLEKAEKLSKENNTQ